MTARKIENANDSSELCLSRPTRHIRCVIVEYISSTSRQASLNCREIRNSSGFGMLCLKTVINPSLSQQFSIALSAHSTHMNAPTREKPDVPFGFSLAGYRAGSQVQDSSLAEALITVTSKNFHIFIVQRHAHRKPFSALLTGTCDPILRQP